MELQRIGSLWREARGSLVSRCSATLASVAASPRGERQGLKGSNYPRQPSQVAVLHTLPPRPKSQDKCYRGVRGDTPATQTQVGMNGDTFSIKAPKECSKKFGAVFKGNSLPEDFGVPL